MSLVPTFSLTPRSSYFYSGLHTRAQLAVRGVTCYPNFYANYRYSFDHQHAQDELYFHSHMAVDSSVDYSIYNNRRRVPHALLNFDLGSFGAQKELALVFGFDALSESRLLIFSDAEQLADETLEVGDNQFLMEIESLAGLNLYFIHAQKPGSSYGGDWFVRGVTGYVI